MRHPCYRRALTWIAGPVHLCWRSHDHPASGRGRRRHALGPRRLIEIVGDEDTLAPLADDAGLELRVLREAWRAERRLDRPALHRLAEALRLPVEELACPGRECEWEWEDTAPLCRACDAPNEIDDHLLNPAEERVTAFLVAARQSVPALRRGSPPSTLPSWTVSPELFTSLPEFGAALARYGARGDVECLDLEGLNACYLPDGPVPSLAGSWCGWAPAESI